MKVYISFIKLVIEFRKWVGIFSVDTRNGLDIKRGSGDLSG